MLQLFFLEKILGNKLLFFEKILGNSVEFFLAAYQILIVKGLREGLPHLRTSSIGFFILFLNHSQVARERHHFQHGGLPRLRAAHQVGASSATQPFGPAAMGFPHTYPLARHEAPSADQARAFLRRIGRDAGLAGNVMPHCIN